MSPNVNIALPFRISGIDMTRPNVSIKNHHCFSQPYLQIELLTISPLIFNLLYDQLQKMARLIKPIVIFDKTIKSLCYLCEKLNLSDDNSRQFSVKSKKRYLLFQKCRYDIIESKVYFYKLTLELKVYYHRIKGVLLQN